MNVSFLSVLVCLGVLPLVAAEPARLSVVRQPDSIVIKAGDQVVVNYRLTRPADSKLAVESGCYFHPLATPKGTVITEVAPADHLHHRGVFLAFVEMHGKKDADFWGWGEHAPKAGRKIVNREIAISANGFAANNSWEADGVVLVRELLQVSVTAWPEANVLDLQYALTAEADVTLARWAFSGFCVRTRKDGKIEAAGPEGAVALPNPSHLKPESDWPAAAWYDYTLTFTNKEVAGVAVINHPKNPPTLWHNHRDTRMINPSIVAPAAVTLKAGEPLVLRYRVVAHDGPVPGDLLTRLTKEWK